MAGDRMDRQRAAAEAQLDRVDAETVDEPRPAAAEAVDPDAGMRVDDGAADADGDLLDDEPHVVAEGADTVDALVEGFNARDLDRIDELCAGDCELPGLASELDDLAAALWDLWERRPTVTLTRAVHDGQAVGVLWERDGVRWAPVGTLHVDLAEDGRAGVLEFCDDLALLDLLDAEPPDGDLEEGARWEEWDEGAE